MTQVPSGTRSPRVSRRKGLSRMFMSGSVVAIRPRPKGGPEGGETCAAGLADAAGWRKPSSARASTNRLRLRNAHIPLRRAMRGWRCLSPLPLRAMACTHRLWLWRRVRKRPAFRLVGSLRKRVSSPASRGQICSRRGKGIRDARLSWIPFPSRPDGRSTQGLCKGLLMGKVGPAPGVACKLA